MKLEKINSYKLRKCYCVSSIMYKNKEHLLVAAEKEDPCYLFDLDGNKEEIIWEKPGGTMTMVQMPNSDGEFIATHKFYSPNDSKEAKLVHVKPVGKDNWQFTTIAYIPFVHRFGILKRNGINYLLACCLKSGYQHKDDWSMPGYVAACVLPNDLANYNESNLLKLETIKKDLLKNHGYGQYETSQGSVALITSESGVMKFVPPETRDGKWEIEVLIEDPVSDVRNIDFDNDGVDELITISPFHGNKISIYKKLNNKYEKVYSCELELEFAHAIWGGVIYGLPYAIIGHREGAKNMYGITYKKGEYQVELLAEGNGAANCMVYHKGEQARLISANREINEIAFYKIEN